MANYTGPGKITGDTLSAAEVNELIASVNSKIEQAEANAVAADLRGGVATEGDTLAKLYTLHQALNAIVTDTTPDGNNFTTTVQEVLQAFAAYPEGLDIMQALAAKQDAGSYATTAELTDAISSAATAAASAAKPASTITEDATHRFTNDTDKALLVYTGTPATDLTAIEAWGDSRTQGVTVQASSPGTDDPWTAKLATLAGITVNNRGVGGETSTQIKTRFLASTTAQKARPQIIWCGRNNIPDYTTIKADIAAMVAAIPHDSYLILGEVPNPTEAATENTGYPAMMQYNLDMAVLYGWHFVDIHTWMLSQYNPANTTDVANYGKSILPGTLTTDGTHYTSLGYQKIANKLFQYIPLLLFTRASLYSELRNRDVIKRDVIGSVQRSDGFFNRLVAGYLEISKDGQIRQGPNTIFRYNPVAQSTHVGRFANPSGQFATTVTTNTVMGDQAVLNTNPMYATVFGWSSAQNMTGQFNLVLGWSTANNKTSGNNNIIIGNNINSPTATGTGELNIGNIIFGSGVTGTGATIAGSISIGVKSPDATAVLDVASTTKGFLPPRMTVAQRDAISGTKAAGLTIYCTDATATDTSAGVMQTWNGSAWKNNW